MAPTKDRGRERGPALAAAPPAAAVEFELPIGWPAGGGARRRRGRMRPARAGEEVAALGDFRVFAAPERLLPVLLEKVCAFEGLAPPRAAAFGALALADLALLEDLYRRLNGYPPADGRTYAI